MNINSIGSASATSAISNAKPSSVARASSIPPPKAAASATISKPGELLSRLQQLQAADPAKLKEVAGQLSKDLTTAAKGATGDAQARLTKLADSLTQVASTGDLSSLQPQKRTGGHRHGGHHGVGRQGATNAVSTAVSSAIDTVTQALGAGAASATSATAAAVTSASTSTK